VREHRGSLKMECRVRLERLLGAQSERRPLRARVCAANAGHAARWSVTIGNCFRSAWNSTCKSTIAPCRPLIKDDGLAHGASLGHFNRGSKRGLRLISRPITKKKTVIAPSLIQSNNGLLSSKRPERKSEERLPDAGEPVRPSGVGQHQRDDRTGQ
jgi:hypothetical protein